MSIKNWIKTRRFVKAEKKGKKLDMKIQEQNFKAYVGLKRQGPHGLGTSLEDLMERNGVNER